MTATTRVIVSPALRSQAANQPGPLIGYADHHTPGQVSGWAKTITWGDAAASPDHPVRLDIFAGATWLGQVTANLFRLDLLAAGYGTGHHGFTFDLTAAPAGQITVRRAQDGAMLPAGQIQ